MKRVLSAVLGVVLVAGPSATRAEDLPKKTLAECIAVAVASHPDLKASSAAADAGHQRTWQAISSALPQVSANYNADRRHTTTSARTGTASGSGGGDHEQTFNFYSTGVNLSQILFDFGQSLDAIRSARATEQSLRADEATQRETVLFGVKQAYYALLTAKRLLIVADENVAQNQKHLDSAKGRFDVGLATKFDVTQAQVQLATAELSALTAKNNVAVARETLRNALGLETPLDFDVVDTFDAHAVRIDEPKALELAYAKRPELRSQQLQQESLEHRIAALQKDYLPNVSGDASYTWSGSQYPLQDSWNLGAAVNWSVFNGGLTTSQIGEARANLSSLKYKEQSLRQQISLQVRQAVLNLGQAIESIRVSEKGVDQAHENLAIAEGRYGAGVGNIIELTDAQASLTTAEGNHVQTLSNYKTAIAALEQATAESFGEDSGPSSPTP